MNWVQYLRWEILSGIVQWQFHLTQNSLHKEGQHHKENRIYFNFSLFLLRSFARIWFFNKKLISFASDCDYFPTHNDFFLILFWFEFNETSCNHNSLLRNDQMIIFRNLSSNWITLTDSETHRPAHKTVEACRITFSWRFIGYY